MTANDIRAKIKEKVGLTNLNDGDSIRGGLATIGIVGEQAEQRLLSARVGIEYELDPEGPKFGPDAEDFDTIQQYIDYDYEPPLEEDAALARSMDKLVQQSERGSEKLSDYLKKHELLGRWKFSNNRLTLMDFGGNGVIASWDSTTRHVMGILQSLRNVADQKPKAGKSSATMFVAKGELELEDEAKLSYHMAVELVYEAGEIVERVLKIEPTPPDDKNLNNSSVKVSTKEGATLFIPSDDGMKEIQLKER